MGKPKKDWTGKTFNHLTFVRPTDEKTTGDTKWELLCSCGKSCYARAGFENTKKRYKYLVANGLITED